MHADGAAVKVSQALIHEQDIKVPAFPDNHTSVEVFRKWYKSVARYCARKPLFVEAETVFSAIRGWGHALDVDAEISQMFANAES